jgi:hypothetical protein
VLLTSVVICLLSTGAPARKSLDEMIYTSSFLDVYFAMGHVIIPTAHCSDGPLFRQPISPPTHYSVKNGQK